MACPPTQIGRTHNPSPQHRASLRIRNLNTILIKDAEVLAQGVPECCDCCCLAADIVWKIAITRRRYTLCQHFCVLDEKSTRLLQRSALLALSTAVCLLVMLRGAHHHEDLLSGVVVPQLSNGCPDAISCVDVALILHKHLPVCVQRPDRILPGLVHVLRLQMIERVQVLKNFQGSASGSQRHTQWTASPLPLS